jgi:predicted PurR-regulated permease PerM/CheY-like chemotaxis protein
MQAEGTNQVTRPRGRGFLASEPLLLVALIILVLYFGRTLLVPMAFALVLNFLLAPAVSFLERYIRRGPAVALVILVFFTGMGVTAWVVARQLVHVAETLPDYRDNIQGKLDHVHASFGGAAGHALTSVEDMVQQFAREPNPAMTKVQTRAERERERERALARERERRRRSGPASSAAQLAIPANQTANGEPTPVPVQVVEPPVTIGTYVRGFVGPMLEPLGETGMVMIFTIYMLMYREDLRNRVLLLAGMGRLNLMTQAIQDGASRISRFLAWQFLVNACYGLVAGLALSAIGVPDATLWGALAAILRYVPYVGPVAGGLLPICFSIAVSPGWTMPLEVFGLFMALEITTANFFEPWLYGSRTGVSALALLASAVFWSILWGGAGLVLATPLTVCLIVMGRYVPQMRFLHVLLGEEAELAPEAKLYERLLAADQEEVEAIADRFLATRPLAAFYDTVLLPTLALAEQDRHKGGTEEARVNFLFLSMGEVISELAEHPEPNADKVCPLPGRQGGAPVVCIPASDRADELTATMLAQILERSGHNTLLLPSASVVPEILDRLAQDPHTIICVAAMPPFAFTPVRALMTKLRQSLPRHRILAALWLSQQDSKTLRQRFGAKSPDALVKTLIEARDQIEQWQQDMQPNQEPEAVPAEASASPA